MTRVNATIVKKDKKDKQYEKDLSQMECYSCHKEGDYANKCPNK